MPARESAHQRAPLLNAPTRRYVLQMKLITISAVSDRLKIQGSLARAGIRELVKKGLIRAVSYHSQAPVYTRASHE